VKKKEYVKRQSAATSVDMEMVDAALRKARRAKNKGGAETGGGGGKGKWSHTTRKSWGILDDRLSASTDEKRRKGLTR